MLFKKARNNQKAVIREVSLDELLAEVWKTLEKSESASGKVLIKADPRKLEEQARDMKIIEGLIDDVKDAEDRDELLRLKQITGLAELFADKEFSLGDADEDAAE